jgi:hypothetical protein
MLKPQIPNIPGVGAVTDTLEFVKNLWGSMSVPGVAMPGMSVPTLSVDDLDKKIADLKAVESWLNVNVSMLHGTIQALEIQRGTIATIKSMGASLAEAMKQPGADEKSILAAAPFASAFFAQPGAAAAAPEPAKPSPPEAAAPAAAPAMPNPAIWWNLLQDQFRQAVSSAMSSAPAAPKEPASGAQGEAAPAKPDRRVPAKGGPAKPKAGKS